MGFGAHLATEAPLLPLLTSLEAQNDQSETHLPIATQELT